LKPSKQCPAAKLCIASVQTSPRTAGFCVGRKHCQLHREPKNSASSRIASEEKKQNQWPWCLALATLPLLQLAAALEDCFSRLQKAFFGYTSGKSKDVLENHGISLRFASLAAIYGSVPYPCSTPAQKEVVALNKL